MKDINFKHIHWALALYLPLTSAFSYAEKEPSAPSHVRINQQWLTTLTLESHSFNEQAAAENLVDSSATSLGIQGSYFVNPNLSLTAGMSFLRYSDKAPYTARVKYQNSGSVKTESSDASALPIYGEVQYAFPLATQKISYISAGVGLAILIGSERDIPNCSDCPSSDIDMDGGAYGIFEWGTQVGESWGLGIAYKQYLSGDFENTISGRVTWGY